MQDDHLSQHDPVAHGKSPQAASGPFVDRLFVLGFLLMAPLLALLTIQEVYTPLALRTYALPVLALELALCVAAFAASPKDRSLSQRLSPAAKALGALWFISVTVSLLGAQYNPTGGQIRYAMTVLHIFFAVALWMHLSDRPALRRDCLVAAASGLGVLIVIAFAFGVWSAGRTDFPWTTFGIGVSNIRHYGYLALALTGIAAGLWLTAEKGRAEALPAGLFFLGTFMIMWTGGRGAFLALLVQLAALVFLAPAGQRATFGMRLLAVIVVATLLAGIYVPAKHFGPLNIFLRLDTGAMPGEEYMTGRAEIWRQTAARIPEHLWFGYGEAQFRLVVPAARGVYNHPHNLPLQLLMQWGLIGTGLLIAILARLAWKAWPLLKKPSPLTYPAAAVITGLLAVSMVDGPLFYALPTAMFALALAVLVAEAQDGAVERETFRK